MPASILGEVGGFLEAALTRSTVPRPSCPSRGFGQIARMPGDDGGISSVCTARGHSRS
ncbi:hypothetical protein ACIQKE_09105 [Streptomyces griseoviridis]|uniref:hypothetical protein n=1 Tax=Streptomyces griseoviridis TaxID=45398 RepID=UPI00340DA451